MTNTVGDCDPKERLLEKINSLEEKNTELTFVLLEKTERIIELEKENALIQRDMLAVKRLISSMIDVTLNYGYDGKYKQKSKEKTSVHQTDSL